MSNRKTACTRLADPRVPVSGAAFFSIKLMFVEMQGLDAPERKRKALRKAQGIPSTTSGFGVADLALSYCGPIGGCRVSARTM